MLIAVIHVNIRLICLIITSFVSTFSRPGIDAAVITALIAKNVPSMRNETDLTEGRGYTFMENKSIFDDDQLDRCYLCGAYGHMDEHHIFGGPNRSTSDKYGLVVHLCRNCHSLIHDSEKGAPMKQHLHEIGQLAFEQRFGNRNAFIKEFIRSYL